MINAKSIYKTVCQKPASIHF